MSEASLTGYVRRTKERIKSNGSGVGRGDRAIDSVSMKENRKADTREKKTEA